MERRLFDRKKFWLNAALQAPDGFSVPCIIQDFCAGGVLVQLAGVLSSTAELPSSFNQGNAVTLIFDVEQSRFELEVLVRHMLDDQLGLQFRTSNARVINAFRSLHHRQQPMRSGQYDRMPIDDDVSNACNNIPQPKLAVPQATPEERDRSLAAMHDFTRQFVMERLAAFFEALDESRNDAGVWGAGFSGNSATDIVALLLSERRVIVKKIAEQVLPFFSVNGMRSALEAIDQREEIEHSAKMSLVEKDEFEEWLHVKVMARRLEDQSQAELDALSARIRYLIGIVVTPANNRLTPESWVSYLRESLNDIPIDFNTLKIILDCYQKHVLEYLKIYYGTLNSCLDDNGILPGDAFQEFIIANARTELSRRQIEQASQVSNDLLDPVLAEMSDVLDMIPSEEFSGRTSLGQSPGGGQGFDEDDFSSAQSPLEGAGNGALPAEALEQLTEGLASAGSGNGRGLSIGNALTVTQLAKQAYGAARRFVQSNLALTTVSGLQDAHNNAIGLQGGLSIVDTVLNDQISDKALDDPNALALDDVLEALDKYLRNEEKRSISLNDFDADLLTYMKGELGSEKHWDGDLANAIALTKKLFSLLDRHKQISDKARERLTSFAVITFKGLLIDPDALIVEGKPLRSLLNLLAKTGLKGAIINRAQDAAIEESISKIFESPSRDFSVLYPLIDQLSEVYRQQVQFFERNIERLRETCEGQYRIAIHRQKVDSAINQRLSGRSVPYVISQFVECGWRDLMYFSLMKEGEDSKGWNMALVLLEDLIRLLSSKKIRMDALCMTPDKMMALIERGLLKVTTPQNAHQQNELIPQLRLLLTGKAQLTPDDFEPWRGTAVRPQVAVSEPNALRINISAFTEADDEFKPHLEKWLRRARALALGSWLEFQLESGERMAGRMLWRAEDDSRLVFVNRQGLKLSDININELAEGLHRGDILILTSEEEPSIERGLDSLVQEVYSELANEVARDELTNLLTRREVERLLCRYLEDVHGGKPEFSLIYVRVDQLSSINASCGYEAGDAVLKQLSERLFDSSKADIDVGRCSGTDFVVILQNASSKSIQKEADRLLSSIMTYRFEWEKMQFSVGASIGVVEVDDIYQSVDSILMDAQSACLTALEEGGNRVQVYSRDERSIQRQQNRIVWASKVDEVLDSQSLRLKVQKIAPTQVALAETSELLLPHYEVLIGSVGDSVASVSDFISAAERYKRMGQVDRWIVEKVCKWLATNRDFVETIGGLSINLSGSSLNDGEFVDNLFEIFSETQVPCDKICFEITETVALENLNDTVDFMEEMKSLGCRFAMDDFGTGMSSFAYLKHLPVDYLKVDGAFVKDMQSSRHDMAMVKSITDMGHLLGKKVVAEYVADAATLSHLESIGVDYCQGFYIEEPIWFDRWSDDSGVLSAENRPSDAEPKLNPDQGVA